MTAFLLRPLAMGLALAASVLAVSCSKPAVATGSTGASVGDDGYSMGNAKAPVTVVEYASASCSHCARWDAEIFPEFKKKYVDTGKVHYIYREFLTPPEPYAAGAFLLARCAGPDKYLGVVEAAYRGQQEMFTTQDMRGPLLKAAQSAGMNEQQFTTCTSDQKAILALNDRVQKGDNRRQGDRHAHLRSEWRAPRRTGRRRASRWTSYRPPSTPCSPRNRRAGRNAGRVQFQRLRLSGFKSFVEPTDFRIEPGLTAVVGTERLRQVQPARSLALGHGRQFRQGHARGRHGRCDLRRRRVSAPRATGPKSCCRSTIPTAPPRPASTTPA